MRSPPSRCERLKLTRKDVELKELGDSLKRLEALKAGEVKATMLNEPFATAARDMGSSRSSTSPPSASRGCSRRWW